MAGGSREPESDDDQQCAECGLWFASAGVISHERNCNLKDYDRRLQPLTCPFAVMRAPDVDPGEEDDEPVEAELVDEPADPDLGSEIVVEDAPTDPGADPGGDPMETAARTDGGPMAVPAFESDDEDDEVEDDDEDALACPGCGGWNLDDPEEALPEEALRSTPAVREFDHICIDCSTDENGTWTSPVEVFNA